MTLALSRVIPNSAAWAWKRRSIGRRQGRVDRVAQELVAEVVVTLVDVAEGEQERRVDQLLDGRLQFAERAVDHAGHHVRAEARPDDRGGARDQPCVVRQAGEPGEDRVRDRVRHPGFADPSAVRPRIVARAPRAAPRCAAGCRSFARGRRPRRRAAPGSWPPRIRVVATPVCSSVSGWRRASRAWRWLSSRARHSRWRESGWELVRPIRRRAGTAGRSPPWRASSPMTSRLISSVQ